MQGSKRDTKNKLLDSVGEGEAGIFKRIAVKHIHYICKTDDHCEFDI